MNLQSNKIFILGLFSLFIACKSLNTTTNINKKELPKTFLSSASNSENISKLQWKKMFKDSLLISLIDTALKNNIDLNITLEKINISRLGLRYQNGEMLPKINFSPNGGIRKFGLYTMDGAGNISTEITPQQIVPINLPDTYLGFQSIWEIDFFGKLKNQKKSAAANYLASIEGANYIVTSLINEVAISYYELLALDHEIEIITKTSLNQKEALEIIKVEKETGRANELAVKQFSAQLLNNKSLEQETIQRITEYENRINFLLGRYPQNIIRKKDDLFKDTFQELEVGFPSQLLENRPDIREAEQLLKSTKCDLLAAKASFFPNFTIASGIGFQAFKPEYLFLSPASIAYSAIGSLTAPLINRNGIKANFGKAKSTQIIAMFNFQKSVINAFVEVENQINSIKNLTKINELKNEESKILSDGVFTAMELYKYGRAGYLEVLYAQKNYMQTQLEYIQTLKRQQISKVNLYKALGGGWSK